MVNFEKRIKNIKNLFKKWTEFDFQGYVNTVNLLLEYGSNVNCKNNHGDIPLHTAAFFGSVQWEFETHDCSNVLRIIIILVLNKMGKK